MQPSSTPGKFTGVALFCVGHRQRVRVAARLLPDSGGPSLARRLGMELGPIGTGFFISFVFLVVGSSSDAIPAIIIVGTILEPLARSAGPRSPFISP
jgi:hypothetical protein